MSEVKHTAFPWTVEDGTTTGKKIIAPNAAKSKRNVAHIGGPDREDNAAFLLRAAQSYASDQAKIAALVEALKGLLGHSGLDVDATDKDDEDLALETFARAALKLAEGQP